MNHAAYTDSVAWYLVQTKSRQEFRALDQLENQGHVCFLPTIQFERTRSGKLYTVREPLFARYLFLQLNMHDCNWTAIRSTRGVSSLVAFGGRFATLPDACVEAIRSATGAAPMRMFEPGERVAIVEGPFAGLEGIYQLADGDARALVLIELMSQPQKLKFAVSALKKVRELA